MVVITNSKKEAETLLTQIEYIEDRIGVKLKKLFIHVDSKEEKETLRDVNKHWKDVDILIYTPTILAGCSYEIESFDIIFGWFTGNSCDYKQSLQMINRVRNIFTKQYHIFITNDIEKEPFTIESLEKALQYNEEMVVNEFQNLPDSQTRLDENLNVVYPCKDMNYYLYLVNNVFKSQSACRFKELFTHHLESSGFVIVNIENLELEDDVDKVKEIMKENKMIKDDIKLQNCKDIAESECLTSEQMEALKERVDELTIEEKNSMEKFKLMKVYDVKEEKITSDFVSIYNEHKNISIFKSWKYMNKNELVRYKKPKDTIEDPFFGNFKYHKIEVCNKILRSFMNGRSFTTLLNTSFSYNELDNCADAFYDEYIKKREQLKHLFGLIIKIGAESKDKRGYLTSVLYKCFGIRLRYSGNSCCFNLDKIFKIENDKIRPNI